LPRIFFVSERRRLDSTSFAFVLIDYFVGWALKKCIRQAGIWLLKLAEICIQKNAQNGKFYAKFGKSSNEGNAMDQAFPVESVTANCAKFFASAASFIFRSSHRRSGAVFSFSGI